MSKSQRKQAKPQTTVRAETAATTDAFSIVVGAMVTMVALAFVHFGVVELWSPFSSFTLQGIAVAGQGGAMYRAIAFSAFAGGLATVATGSRTSGPQAPLACSLGWGIWGLTVHAQSSGTFMKLLPDRTSAPGAGVIFFSNGPPQAITVAFGLLLASGTAWIVARAYSRGKHVQPKPADTGSNVTVFSNAMSYPMIVAAMGAAFLFLGGVFLLPLGELAPAALPSPLFNAVLCAGLATLAFGGAAFITRRNFNTIGTIGYTVAAPMVVAFITGIFLAARGQFPLLRPAALLVYQGSAFEVASWGAVGSILGYYLAARLTSQSAGKISPAR